jgi:hypothetical protein
MGPADVMAAKVPEASKSSMKSDGSGDVTIEGFSDSKKVTRTFLLGSDLQTKRKEDRETWSLGLGRNTGRGGICGCQREVVRGYGEISTMSGLTVCTPHEVLVE